MRDKYFIGALIFSALIWNMLHGAVFGAATPLSVSIALALLAIQIICLVLQIREDRNVW